MTRKRLWSLTALACALLLVPSVPRMSIPWSRLVELTRLTDRLPALHMPSLSTHAIPSPEIAVVVALLTLLLTAITVRRRRPRTSLAIALARRGRPVVAIARHTRLSQDAIRDLLGGEPMVVSTVRRGRIFRRRPKPVVRDAASFADELREKSFDARA
jgi:hypothetical protein